MSNTGDQTDKPAAGGASSGGSSSPQEQGGGARLDARFDALTIEPLENKNTNMGHSRILSGLPQGYRGNIAQNPAQFQVGNVPSDGDVFMSAGGASLATARPTNAAPGGVLASYPAYPANQPGASGEAILGPGSGRDRSSAGVDAQAYYPASACVFVANLPEGIKDSRLEVEVTRAFSAFGTVFVKIRRDHKNMPFAFCQFTKTEEAQVAKARGKGIMIDGRPCRTEMVKANRSFVIYNAQGFDIGVEEARYQLAGYGPMSKCELLHPHILEALKLSSGVIVEFTTFDPGRDVVSAFRHNAQYRVMPYDLKKALKSQKPDSDEEWLKKYDADRRSIFIGNLPSDMDDLSDVLRGIMGEVGDVEDVHIVQKEVRTGHGRLNVFGFVTFARPDMADLAIQRLDGITVGGCRIRVERKSSRNGPQPRRMQSNVAMSQTSPAPIMGASSSANSNPPPATPLRSVTGAMAESSAAEEHLGTADITGNIPSAPVNYRTGYAAPFGNFPATPQGTPGVVSPYNGAYGSGSHGTYGSGSHGTYGSGSTSLANPYFWATPYLTDPAMGMPNMPYYRADTNYSPAVPSAQPQTQDQTYAPVPAPRATGHTGTPTRSASQDELFKSESEEIKSAKSA